MKMSISDMNTMLPKTFLRIASRIGQLNEGEKREKVSAQEMSNFIKD